VYIYGIFPHFSYIEAILRKIEAFQVKLGVFLNAEVREAEN
jgi:hypothetical protein